MSIEFLDNLGIKYKTSGDHHCSPGWAQIQCPFCADSSWHMGFHIERRYFNCYKCGHHHADSVVAELLDIEKGKAQKILRDAGESVRPSIKRKNKINAHNANVVWPSDIGPMRRHHRRYLIKRGFDPDILEIEYAIKGTGPIGSYANRVIAPITYEGVPVSYVGRDISDKARARYKTAPSEDEVRPIKHCLYGLDDVAGDTVVVVEGVTDVWRLGRGAVATFGIQTTHEQVRLLKRFTNIVVLFDPEPKAQDMARDVASRLMDGRRSVCTAVLDSAADPGSMKNADARALMREFLGL